VTPDTDLIFFDEIQRSPQAFMALRYFYEEYPQLAIVAAGSLLDFLLESPGISVPVGRIEYYYLGPVSFSEYLLAKNKNQILEEFNNSPDKISEMQIYIPPGPRLGDIVAQAKDLGMSFGETILFENVNFTIPPGAVVGIIGPNGAGKTTLFKLITGQLKPTQGSLMVGETVKTSYVDQSREALSDDKTGTEDSKRTSDG